MFIRNFASFNIQGLTFKGKKEINDGNYENNCGIV